MATLKDIAENAGISIGTVDRILHKRGRFSSETADKVRRITRELGYTPNLMARQLSKSKNCRIGVFLPRPEQDSAYWSLPLNGIRRAERELGPFGLSLEILHYDRYDAESFNKVGSKLQGAYYDGILMAPLLGSEVLSLLAGISPEIPVIFFDTDLPEAKRLSYIGQNSYQSGRLGARLINMLTRGGHYGHSADAGRNLIITPDSENEHLSNRIRGFTDYSKGPLETLRITVESDHNLQAFGNLLKSRLTSDITGVFVVDASAHFVADYMADNLAGSQTPNLQTPALIGYDLVPENRKWLKSGVIDFLLTQRPAEQGYNGISKLFRKIFLDEDCPEHEYTPIDIVTLENLKYLIDKEEI
ncbi:MAG: substrate-binding domain-containing protein [Spirochaetaceae bacterium]|nr:substrate-binding domain-containing protein [Spirochaetaceae bacterium]